MRKGPPQRQPVRGQPAAEVKQTYADYARRNDQQMHRGRGFDSRRLHSSDKARLKPGLVDFLIFSPGADEKAVGLDLV